MTREILTPQGIGDRLQAFRARRKETAVVAILVLVSAGVAGALWRAAAPPARIAPFAEAASGGKKAAQTSRIFVHVAGEVRRPGLYRLSEGARVANAIRRAGGPTRRADLDALNLAETLADGAKVLVPPKGAQPVAAPSPGMPGSSPAPSPGGVGAQIDLNTADQAALEAIPGIGPVKAQAILAYREEIGTFTSVEQLLEVDGIGPATLESVRSYVRV